MKNSSFSVRLFLNTNRLKDDGTAPICVRLRLNGLKSELYTNKYIDPKHWDSASQTVIITKQAKDINKFLDSYKTKINNAYSQLFIANQEITLDSIKSLLSGIAVKKTYTLLQVAEEHNKHFESMLGIKYSQGSYKNYKSTLKYLREFVPLYCKKSDIQLPSVNYKFAEAYFTFLTTEKNCHTNGANKQIQRLKKLLNYAIRADYIQANPMATFQIEFEECQKIALTIDEIRKLSELKLYNSTLEIVREVFLLQCFTGMAYSDVKRLTFNDIQTDEKGAKWIKMFRQKTQIRFSVPLLDAANVILDKYMVDTGRPLLAVISNQKMNANLKILQELAKIPKRLTTHLARHTFATTITLSNGVPIETVSKMLGHTKLSTTQIYAKVLDNKIAEDMKGLNSILNKN